MKRRRFIIVFALSLLLLLLGISILLPGLEKLRRFARPPTFISARNLSQIGLAILMYANDHQHQLPDSLQTLQANEDISPEIFVYPGSGDTPASGATKQAMLAEFAKPGHSSYVYFGAGLLDGTDPTIVLACEAVGINAAGSNVLFLDGRVEWLEAAEVQKIRAARGPGPIVWRWEAMTQPSTQPAAR